ncbi:magnesium transporter CorA family protein [Paenibacillus prosopidis]|uniref:Mg2+ and Co2+ transporter CorA n=1 Tax=Paenibacillus prosopidis TaxID=630520 RepID=A0A368VTE2_9BACL|nr:magnesium transporter CorA family protein [Paenibacillus prosopidis]RCW44321.1 Mg2+ and Co2+ transporter CorA [Paenibacillus prosopidis]
MFHRMLRYPAGWEWHVLQQVRQQAARQEPLPSRKNMLKQTAVMGDAQRATKINAKTTEQDAAEQHADKLKRLFPECASWIDECEGRRTNQISVGNAAGSVQMLYGTLVFQVSDDQSDTQPFHFWLTNERLITMHEDMRLPLRLQSVEHMQKLDSCDTAPEALFIMLSIILETFHSGLDGFETRLGELESTMRKENRTGLIDVIFERRYELLHWSHLFIPVRELHGAAKEAFMTELIDTEGFKRITHKLERIDALLKHYALEIDTLISMDDAISSFRGNDIMKTLTIFTVLFLPATVAGAIWGSNFDHLPLKEHKWGFVGLISVIAVITIIIYIWLWRKGWTGDLLNGRKPQEIVADTSTSGRTRKSRSKSSKKHSKHTSATASSVTEPLSRRKRT